MADGAVTVGLHMCCGIRKRVVLYVPQGDSDGHLQTVRAARCDGDARGGVVVSQRTVVPQGEESAVKYKRLLNEFLKTFTNLNCRKS